MERVKKYIAKLLIDVRKYYSSKETWKDGIYIGLILLIMTSLPSIYYRIPISKWRLLLAVFLFSISFGLLLFMIHRILKRHWMQNQEKADWLQFLKRILILCIVLVIAVALQVRILYPAFSGIAVIQLSGGKKLIVWIVQSVFFSFYSQAFISACIRIEQSIKEWLKRFAKSCCKSILPLALLTLLITVGIQQISDILPILAQVLSVLFTTFLWITAIMIQERENYEH